METLATGVEASIGNVTISVCTPAIGSNEIAGEGELSGGDAKWHEEKKQDTTTRDPKHIHCTFKFDLECTNYAHYSATERPLAEPPMFDYDIFAERDPPSDL